MLLPRFLRVKPDILIDWIEWETKCRKTRYTGQASFTLHFKDGKVKITEWREGPKVHEIPDID